MTDKPILDLPDGWEIEDEQQGGQPNGSGVIEHSDAREWFTVQRETHHRRVITLWGPWEEGATEGALIEQEINRRNRDRDLLRHEAQILRDAQKIIERRQRGGPT